MKTHEMFTNACDVGQVKKNGSHVFDSENEAYLLKSSLKNTSTSDAIYYVYRKQQKSFIINAILDWVQWAKGSDQKAGLMIRESINDSSKFFAISYHGNGFISIQYRTENGSNTEELRFSEQECNVLQINCTEDKIQAYAAKMGQPLKNKGTVSIKFPDSLLAGIFISSQNNEESSVCKFSNTRIYQMVKPDFIPYHDYIGSQLEIIDIETNVRKIIYTTSEPIEAPNWSRDGNYLIFNSIGLLYKLNIGDDKPQKIFTGFADENNNDHGISFDGKLLAISHHSKDKPQGENSLIYVLPIEGGTPKLIIENGPSYWHGWSPDDHWLVYTAKRNNRWNIYKIAIDGGQEIQLTDNEFLNDGPEFSPDGNYIWFNSNRTGKMQIWRMKADGSEQIQITHDEFQNWFPHPSPDGSKIVFLSYRPDEVNEWDHPYYKQVMIRIMDSNGENIKTIAYLYGGQGTINVPSWSPDGKKIAFISNTQSIQ